MEIDAGYAEIGRVIEAYAQLRLEDANEAETRKKVIDVILERVLGWSPSDDIKYEERIQEDSQARWADYVLATAATSIVIEAKRLGEAFNLPANRTSAILGGVLKEGAVGSAIRQVRDYARGLAIPFAVATNGSAWIIFPAVRTDRVTFEQTQAHIFRDLQDIKQRFVQFWELLSRQRVIEGSLESALFGDQRHVENRRLISLIREPGYRLGRNTVYEYIETAVTAALTDEAILSDDEALKYCYVKNSERVKYDSRLRMYLADTKPHLERKVIRPRHRSSARALDETLQRTEAHPPQFLLVLGQVGAGKTTFLHYTRRLSAADIIAGHIVWLYVDFRKATPADDPRSFIYQELLRLIDEDREFNLGSWESSIQPAYRGTIKVLQTGALALLYRNDHVAFETKVANSIMQDRESVVPFVEKILSHAAAQRTVFLVVDNVDQFEDGEYQSQIFVEAQAAARKMSLSVIMSLRDATYLHHRSKPVFDAFQVDTIYIDPPQVRPVLSRRFAYAKKSLAGKAAEIVSESGLRLKVEDLSVFFDLVSRSVLSESSGYMIEVMAGGDVRRGLALVREFLASGHTSADSALQTYLTGGEYQFPAHEVFKGAVLGQRKYYREEESLLLNIFDAKLGVPGFQLLRLHIVSRLASRAASATFQGEPLEELEAQLYSVGVPREPLRSLLNRLIENRVLATVGGEPLGDTSVLMATRFGGYLVHELASWFTYLELCAIDASIYDDESWRRLVELTRQIETAGYLKRIELRVERTRAFLEYLQMLEQQWVVGCRRHGISDLWDQEIIRLEQIPKAEDHFANVKASAKNVYEKRQQKEAGPGR